MAEENQIRWMIADGGTTPRPRSEASWPRIEERSRAILASLSANIAVIDRQGGIVAVNPAWEQYADANGVGPDRCWTQANYLDVCRTASSDPNGEGTAAIVADNLRRLLDGKIDEFSLEYPCHSVSEQRWCLLVATPLRHAEGGAVVSHYDITQRKLAEIALMDREERLRAILHTASDAIVTADCGGVIDTINPATEAMFGYSANELVGRRFSDLIHSPSGVEVDGVIQKCSRETPGGQIPAGREMEGRRRDGSPFPLELSVSPLNPQGFYTVILRDISNRKRLQKHLLDVATAEQRRIGQELHDGTQQELTGLSYFAGSILSVLDAASPPSASGSGEWKIAEEDYLHLRETARRLRQGLSQTIQRVNELSHGIMPVQIDSEGLQAALCDLAHATDSRRSIRCRFEGEEPVGVPNNTVATQLFRISQEALNNALRHSQATQINITLSRKENSVVVEIEDNGCGFDPLVSRRPPGLKDGIGLSIMDYRANSIGGTLCIQRNATGGMTVSVIVPIIENQT